MIYKNKKRAQSLADSFGEDAEHQPFGKVVKLPYAKGKGS
jgi:hypothetical protein